MLIADWFKGLFTKATTMDISGNASSGGTFVFAVRGYNKGVLVPISGVTITPDKPETVATVVVNPDGSNGHILFKDVAAPTDVVFTATAGAISAKLTVTVSPAADELRFQI